MPEETVGYVRLEWTCGRCGTINPGPVKKCAGCGAPQPEDQAFELPPQQELVTDEEELRRAKAGPDVHCAYCGARNASDAEICIQCGGPLAEGTARAAGAVLGASQFESVSDIECPFCGANNSGSATKCQNCGAALTREKAQAKSTSIPPAAQRTTTGKKGLGIFAILAIVLACIAVIGGAVFLSQTSEQAGVVTAVGWDHQIAIEELRPVSYEEWRDGVPTGAKLGTCQEKYRYTSEEPAARSKKVCGTSYVKDQGSGYGEVVQECKYEVYDDWCQYTVDEWKVVRTESASGADLNPYWPDVTLDPGQREGNREGRYKITFLSNDKTYDLSTTDVDLFKRCDLGSKWKLQINKLGALVGIEE